MESDVPFAGTFAMHAMVEASRIDGRSGSASVESDSDASQYRVSIGDDVVDHCSASDGVLGRFRRREEMEDECPSRVAWLRLIHATEGASRTRPKRPNLFHLLLSIMATLPTSITYCTATQDT